MSAREIAELQRLLRDPLNYPPELWSWIKGKIENDPPAMTWDSITGFNNAVRKAGAKWTTGDTKISAQSASHKDGSDWWLLADGSVIDPAHTDLRAILGANMPDAVGRALIMVGAHIDVNQIGDNEGQPVGNRRPKHATSVTQNPSGTGGGGSHQHTFGREVVTLQGWYPDSPAPGGYAILGNMGTHDIATDPGGAGGAVSISGGQYGPQGAQVDQPAYVVAGNLFYHT